MSRVTASVEADDGRAVAGGTVAAVARGLGRLVEGAGFVGAVVLPFVAIALLVVQPTGWVPLLFGALFANVLGVLAGHCYGREC